MGGCNGRPLIENTPMIPDHSKGPLKLLTTKEVAALLDVSVGYLQNLRSQNVTSPPFIKVCGGVRYLRDDILNYLKERGTYSEH